MTMEKIAINRPSDLKAGKAPSGQTSNPEREKKLKKVCTDFESILAYQLLKTMRQTIPKGGFIGPSHGKETYEMLMDQKIADDLAKKGQGLGLQKMLYQQMTQQIRKKD
jgi:flagellar protein FlgJ